MTEYALAHPYLTFALAVLAMFVIDNCLGNIARVRLAKRIKKEQKQSDCEPPKP